MRKNYKNNGKNCRFCQAEDGIRDRDVTGVQTCALPIYEPPGVLERGPDHVRHSGVLRRLGHRSEERRVGKEWRSRWSPYHSKKKTQADCIAYKLRWTFFLLYRPLHDALHN